MVGAAIATGAAAYTGCRIGAAKEEGLKTVDIVEIGQIARRSAGAGIWDYRGVIGMHVCRRFMTNSITEEREAIQA